MRQLYFEIISVFNKYQYNKIPISNIGLDYNFSRIDRTEPNEVYRSIKKDNNYTIILSIKSYEHDRTYQICPDTYHNYAYLYENNELIYSHSYMYEDDIYL